MRADNDNLLNPLDLPMGEKQRRARELWPEDPDSQVKGALDVNETVRRFEKLTERCVQDLHSWQETLRSPSKPIPDEAKTRIYRLIRIAQDQIEYNNKQVEWLLHGNWREKRLQKQALITHEIAQIMKLAPFPTLDIS